ncbi:MAG: chemotaxis protein CheC [Myxococcota bacterium]|jgi:chemotaxis protein CheC
MRPPVTELLEERIDRLSELANIGAGHAAGAFSQLTGHTIKMAVPRVRLTGCRGDEGDVGGADLVQPGTTDKGWDSGVIFEFDGCLNAVVAILFRRAMCDSVVRNLVGQSEGFLPPETVESSLMEVGNVLASHVASAIADTLGARLLPSIPMLSLESALEQLETLAKTRPGAGEMWIESELIDDEGNLGGLVVLIPDQEKS